MKKILLVLAVLVVGATTASAQKVRVMSYNVHNCIGSDKVKDVDRCAAVIRNVQPDVVAIQEVDSMTRRNKRYVLGELGEKSGYHAYFGPTIPYRGGKYGIGVLSKKPAKSVTFHRLPCRKEPRGLLVVEFDKYYFLATHLSLVRPDQRESARIIKDIVSKLNKPVLLAGDMNAQPHSPTMEIFKEYMTVLSDPTKFTFPAIDPRACIDHVMGANAQFKVKRNEVLYGDISSDHLPLYVDVKIQKSKKAKAKK
jgi:endonuclease/exonuclease/phosphatase family metal-dependent hydrolase